jgi:uncharacterized protein
MNDIWHFSRPNDTERLMSTLSVGLVSALAIIEPRRRGKTTFLQYDLAPAATANRFVPIYINLAATSGSLETLIAQTILGSLQQQESIAAKLRVMRSRPIKKVSGKASLADAELSADVELASEDKGQLSELFSRLARLKMPVLFLLDEVHRLADNSNRNLAWSLRSLLDSHRNNIKVVATSSSAASYEVLVGGETKAFKSWFSRIVLSPLGQPFVEHLSRIVATHFPAHKITVKQIADAFKELGDSPKFIRDYLNVRILNPTLAHRDALAALVIEAAKDSGFTEEFEGLAPLQKAVLFALANGTSDLFSEQRLDEFRQALVVKELHKTHVQRAVRALATAGWIIKQGHGDYRIADQLFEQWLQTQIRNGLLTGPRREDA